ncbi:hypothetical protein EON65_28145 [archaeon]|nr:MAG: hypothetical protein EON65_28145 [archaeon]
MRIAVRKGLKVENMNGAEGTVNIRRNIRDNSINRRRFGKNCIDRLCDIEIAELSLALIQAIELDD